MGLLKPQMVRKNTGRIIIEYPEPTVDNGRFAIKRCPGDIVSVSVDIFRDGHDKLGACVRSRSRRPRSDGWLEAPLTPIDAHHAGVRWAGQFIVDAVGDWEFEIDAWVDRYGTWSDELERKLAAGQSDLSGELSEGKLLLQEIRDHARSAEDHVGEAALSAALNELEQDPAAVLTPELQATAARYEIREGINTLGPFPVRVDRELARFGAWYELFPRSWGGLRGTEQQIPRLAELGFDVLYLPPIHPIGLTNRKGRDNAPQAEPGEPGSPWAIGDASGGHDAIHPELGDEADLRKLTQTAAEHNIAVALDLALQCSADHPWLKQHPEWFNHRPDGTLKYAENPPKRYQDIYNFNWDSDDWRALWDALLEVVLHWVDCGVTVFRVDNPHTKPAPFWEWLIRRVHRDHQEIVFLAEAFTRRAVMRHLAKLGFSQSYTYFTWKNSRWDLTEYVDELAHTQEREYFRPNFFVNTPDILHEYLQLGGPAAFGARLVLAATLSPSYGIYSGFESFEATPVRQGSEEYLHSEKYEAAQRSLDGPLLPIIQKLNLARRENPALHRLENVTFLDAGNDALIAYAKRSQMQMQMQMQMQTQTQTREQENTVIVVVNLDPHNEQAGLVVVPAHLETAPVFTAHDLLDEHRYEWRIGGNYVLLGPGHAHVLRVQVAG